jgi:hypothetical protein|tara:strand:- start:450 stop:632 length:183 start_codon:yes stop_codon:yes gene_type:complete
MKKLTEEEKFESWIKRINEIIYNDFGMDSTDLIDADYWSMFKEDLSPEESIAIVLDENGY